ncbi:JmjC domain-containing protein [Crossiella sp. CA198]|uniref:JmjC domain-containing protein n=1 Tax=Crossiella sp. CA198 TaxID=3455607 RepID=UPI003F8CF7F5
MSRLDLADWFAPMDLAGFGDSVLGRRILATPARAELAARLRDTLEIHSIDDVFAKQVRRVCAWFQDTAGNTSSALMPAASARRLYDAGMTAFFQEIAEFDPFEREVAETFRVSGHSAKVQLFGNRPGAVTRVHFDPVDVITVQLTGRKVWRVAPNEFTPRPLHGWGAGDPLTPDLRAYQRAAPPERIPGDAEEFTLEPGAVLHVPRGYWHETCSDQDSISLHVLLTPPLRMDFLLAGLKNQLTRDERWRESIYDFETPEEATSRTTVDLAALRDALDRLDPRDLVREPLTQRPVELETRFVRAGQTAFGVDELDPDTARISVSAYGFRDTQTASLRVRREFLPALRWMGDMSAGAPVDIPDVLREAPGLSKEEARELLGMLEKTRLLRRV